MNHLRVGEIVTVEGYGPELDCRCVNCDVPLHHHEVYARRYEDHYEFSTTHHGELMRTRVTLEEWHRGGVTVRWTFHPLRVLFGRVRRGSHHSDYQQFPLAAPAQPASPFASRSDPEWQTAPGEWDEYYDPETVRQVRRAASAISEAVVDERPKRKKKPKAEEAKPTPPKRKGRLLNL